MNRPAACILLAFLVACSLKGQQNQISTPVVQAAEGLPTRTFRGHSRDKPPNFKVMAFTAAKREGVKDPSRFVRQIAAESSFNPCAGSPAGAIGVAQIMPTTADSWGVDPHDPQQALTMAARIMARYERQLGSTELALAAYNAGPGAVQKYGGVPPYSETRRYIEKIMGDEDIAGLKTGGPKIAAGYTRTFRVNLVRLMRDVRQHGGHISVVSGFRSYDEQLSIWNDRKRQYGGWRKAKAWAAPPGCSNHNRGTAADLSGSLTLAHRLAKRHGLAFPMSHEPWHVENA